LNERGVENPLFIALYELPLTYMNLNKEKKPLAIEVRATDSTMGASWFDPTFNKYFFPLLNVDQQKYAESFLKKTLSAYHILLQLGYIHISPHADNMPITGGLTDLGDVEPLTESTRRLLLLRGFFFHYFTSSGICSRSMKNLKKHTEELTLNI